MAPRKKTSLVRHSDRSQPVQGALLGRHKWAWWIADEGEVWKSLCQVAGSIKDRQKAQHREDWRHARLYAGMRPDLVTAFGALGYVAAASSGPSRLPRFSFNVIESVIETAINRITADEIIPSYITDGSQWDGQERAEKLTQFVAGCYHASDFRSVDAEASIDCLVFGTGASRSYMLNGQMRSERIMPLELLVDEEDGMYRDPRMLIRHKSVSRDVVRARVEARDDLSESEKKAMIRAIDKAPVAKTDMLQTSLSDNIFVYEGWHLPSAEGANDGRWVMCIDGVDIFDLPWTKDRFSIEFLRWRTALLGFWGRGIAEQLTGIQIEINRVVSFAQQSLSAAGFKILVETGSNVLDSHFNREIGSIIKYQGTPPTFQTLEPLGQQVMNWLLMLYQKAYELTSISSMAAQGTKPAGINSGAAIRSFDDIQDGHFTRFSKARETWHVRSAEQMIDLARDMALRKKPFAVTVPSRDFMSRLDWKDVDLERDQYIAQVFPESALPKTPQARRETIQEYMQGNLMDRTEGRRLLRIPDLKASDDLDSAPRDLIMKQIGKMLKGMPQTIDPLQDFVLAEQLVTKAYNRAMANDTPADRVTLLRDYLKTLDALRQQAAAANAPQAAPAPANGPPMAKPAQPPTSDMLPFAGSPAAPPNGVAA